MMSSIPQVNTEVHIAGGVVVGDDGSRCAAHAVSVAATEAGRRGVELHVVRAWSIVSAVRPADVPAGIVPSVAELEEATLAAEHARVAELVGSSDLEVTVHVVYGAAAKALLQAAEGAELLVVGSRGLGGFSRLLLGSVAEQVIRHAACDVLVTRLPERNS